MPADIVSRFAPSPTGRLHLGHGYSALLAHDAARAAGGRFLLRIEDIDTGRCRGEFVEAIFEDLRWLGLDWDGEVLFQSARSAAYAAALERLRAMGLAYVCTCTRAEIAASAPHGPAGPVYPGTCRELGRVAEPAVPHCWRLDMGKAVALAILSGTERGTSRGLVEWQVQNGAPPSQRTPTVSLHHPSGGPPLPLGEDLIWYDQLAGDILATPAPHGDIIIARKDAAASYHLAATVDDAAQGVTLVVRGQDLFDATHIHRLLQALLGLPAPEYRHHRLVTGADGERLAKRRGSISLSDLRAANMDGRALAEMMRLGRFPTGFALAAP